MKCSRRIRPIVSTTSIPHRPLHAKAGSRTNRKLGGQFWTPIPRLRGSLFHAGSHPNGVGLPEWPRYGASAEAVMELGDRTGPMPVLDPKRKALFDACLATRLSN